MILYDIYGPICLPNKLCSKKNEHCYLHQIHISAPKYVTFKKDIEKDLILFNAILNGNILFICN